MSNDVQKLNSAKKNKNDEFYTLLVDIEKEMKNYLHFLKGKIVYCNCDNYKRSQFYNYFKINFQEIGIKKLISTCFDKEKGIIAEFDGKNEKIGTLNGNGDFRNLENISILKKVDVIITNPPFSLFREFLDILIEYNKYFVIVGNANALTFKKCFEYIMKNKLWLGYNCVRNFQTPQNILKEGARSFWFTNVEIKKHYENIKLKKKYSLEEYKEYDNFKAIEVNKVKNIPSDYNGTIGVPITFLDKFNPKQFELIGSDFQVKEGKLDFLLKKEWEGKIDRAYLNGKRLYSRIFIKKRTSD